MKKISLLLTIIACGIKMQTIAQNTVYTITSKDDLFFAGTREGIFRSEDEGETWKTASAGIPDAALTNQIVVHKSALYVNTYSNGLYFSENNGELWTSVANYPSASKKIGFLFSNDTAIFVVDFDLGIFYSSDHGVNWKAIEIYPWLEANRPGAGLPESVKEQPVDKKKNKVAVNDQPLVSLDPKITVNAVATGGSWLIVAVHCRTGGGGLVGSVDNGKTWERYLSGPDLSVNSLQTSGEEMFALGSGYAGLFTAKDGGNLWSALAKPPLKWVSVFYADDNYVFAAQNTEGLCVSNDRGITWTKIDAFVAGPNQTIESIYTTKSGLLMVGTNDGIIRLQKDETGVWKVKDKALTSAEVSYHASYPVVGTQNGVTLGARKYGHDVIFEVVNATSSNVNVNIKVLFECKTTSVIGGVTYQKFEIVWRISCPANTTKSYDTHPEACEVVGCKDQTESWQIVEWNVGV